MKRMILVDGNSLMYRAYYGMAANGNLSCTSNGIYTNAIYAFARMMKHLINSSYDNILVAFDAGKKTVRHEIMEDYKAGRAPMPDEFRMQIAYIKQYLDIMNIKQYEQPLYEADDIIGTMARRAEKEGYHVDIYSGDKDLLQLVSDNITVHLTKKGMTDLESYNPSFFYEKYQIKHTQFIDLKALMGDKSDNLPGIPGIGEKKAVKYLQQYETLDGLIEHREELKGADKEKVCTYYEQAILCKRMATIITDFDLPVSIEDTVRRDADKEKLISFYQELEFKSLLKELTLETPVSNNPSSYEVVKDAIRFKEILVDDSSFIFETFEYNYHKSPLIAIAIANKIGTFIVEPETIFSSIDFMMYLSDSNNHKSIFDYKRAFVLLKRLGFEFNGIDFDLLLATYVLNPSIAKEEFKSIADFYQLNDVYYDEQIYGKGAKKALPEFSVIYNHIAKKANFLHSVKMKAVEMLNEKKQLHLLTEIEIPLAKVLGKMEFAGLSVDLAELNRQKDSIQTDIYRLEREIYSLAAHEFNISSPKQLGTLLFEELGIPYPKKKGTSYSTDIEVLTSIKDIHPIVNLVIEYRAKTKLYSTYIQGMADALYPDNKVHTIYQQALTQTGRLSSVEPNLQNIPIRTEEGRMIRKMFVPSNPNNSFISADYSQIELRVLAHMANVVKLKEAFTLGEDIHTKTAKEVFGHSDITSEERRRAKAVNFGIVYGISAFGLANDLGITNALAQDYIKRYYAAYPEIKTFMDDTVEFCKETGYVKTLKNRIRYIPDINSNVYMQREFAKRMAMNAPIQGSAADIIKIAMINIDKELEQNKLSSKLLITIH
ncbi:MAG: DNA polymerase I, partial [Acholeplasmatales bacterium]|nr:DNA polymerase I [Acholeplasmatales bacterium]